MKSAQANTENTTTHSPWNASQHESALQPVQVHLKSRRASVQQGRKLIQEMRRYQSSENNEGGEGEGGGEGVEGVEEECETETKHTNVSIKGQMGGTRDWAEDSKVAEESESLLWKQLVEMVQAGVDLDNFHLYDEKSKTLLSSQGRVLSEQEVEPDMGRAMVCEEREQEVVEPSIIGAENSEVAEESESLLWKQLVDMVQAGVDLDNFHLYDEKSKTLLSSQGRVSSKPVKPVVDLKMSAAMVSGEREL